MKGIERHLYSRKGHYYFRKSFSKNLHFLLPFKEVWISLNTQDVGKARVLSAQIDYELINIINKLKQNLKDILPEQVPDKAIHECVTAITEIKKAYNYQSFENFDHFKKQGAGNLFSEIVNKYLGDCPADAHSTKLHKETTYKLFKEVIGDLPFHLIDKTQALLFKSRLLKLPANAKKKWKIDSFENIDWNKLTTDKPQHPRTINGRLSYMAVLFKWAISAGYYHGQNPFIGLFIPKSQKLTASRTHPFNHKELQVLFQTGGLTNKYPSMYWVPLIGLYSGMRLNEICQLYVSDIRQEEGVYVFDVNDQGEDKGLKTASSRRKVPIHQKLIRQGLLDYLSEIKALGHKRVFPDVPIGQSTKTYSSTFTKRFWRHLKELGVKREGLCFHSLRHTFIDGLRNVGVEKSIAMKLVGHNSANDIHSGYGYGHSLQVLQNNINKLSFPILED